MLCEQNGRSTPQTARLSRADFFIGSEDVQIPWVIHAYEIGGSHYVRLRAVCQTLNVSLAWDGVKKTISIDTTQPYRAK